MASPTGTRTGTSPDRALMAFRIIGASLGLGPTLFALVAWYTNARGDSALATDTGAAAIMFNAMIATVVLGSLAALAWWRFRVAPLLEASEEAGPGLERLGLIQTNVIVAWAMVQAGALFAEVVFYLYDLALAGVLGVVVMWTALLVTWPRREWAGD